MTASIEPVTVTSPKKKSHKRGFFRYILLPGIIPQAKELSRGGFGFLAFLIAYVYQGVRILPANHPYTNINNLGTFGLRDVISVAANNVKFEKRNIDQIVIFFAVLSGIIIMALQFISFLVLVFSGEAFAQTIPDTGLFDTAYPDTDIAFSMLREVFGIPDLFGEIPGGRSAFHTALHGLFNFYNLAILIVAVLVLVYYIIVVVAETAQTGTPFGQRFSHIYAPLRLVIAIGLLVPLNYGLNASQYITLYAAKLGSGFASTGWIAFNDSMETNPLGAENVTLIAPVKAPDINGLVEFMAVVNTCREAYNLYEPVPEGSESLGIEARILQKLEDGTTTPLPYNYSTYETLAAASYNKDIKIQFGKYSNSEVPEWIPYCGEVTIPITVPMEGGSYNAAVGYFENAAESGDLGWLQDQYYVLVRALWEENENLALIGENFARKYHSRYGAYVDPPASRQTEIIATQKGNMDAVLAQHYQDAIARSDFSFTEAMRSLGWGGSGIWYMRVAENVGGYTVATMNAPAPSKFPKVMEDVLEQKRNADGRFSSCEAYEPNLSGNAVVTLDGGYDLSYARIMNDAYQYWTCDNALQTRNFIIDAMSAIFGLEGLISIRDTALDADGNVVQIHPLAKLSALGKGLIESSVRNMGMAVVASGLGGMFNVLESQAAGQGFMAAASMFSSIAVIGLSIGFITFYILPFLPFIYFFFAVGGWVKGIFEAMVGAPLWALAHLRIDGDGIPGKMAMNGYFLIFEIFLRPILTVFGLIGGVAIFSAMAAILNEIFDLVVLNTANVDLDAESAAFSRSTIDTFFFTVVYAIILYMMALSSFKMITLVPNSIIRWLGQSISSFNDNAGDPAGSLTSYAAIGGNQLGSKIAGGITQGSQAVGSGIGGVGNAGGVSFRPPQAGGPGA